MYALILNYPPSLNIMLGTMLGNDAILQTLSFIKQLSYIFFSRTTTLSLSQAVICNYYIYRG